MIEREFPKDSGLIYDGTVTDIDIETKRYKLKWDDDDEFLEKEDNYTGQQIGKYLSTEEMSKFKVGETVRKMFDKLWHDGKIESIDTKKFYRVVYEDNDKEDMTMQEVRKFWVKPEAEDKSSSKKNSRQKNSIQILTLLKQPKFRS